MDLKAMRAAMTQGLCLGPQRRRVVVVWRSACTQSRSADGKQAVQPSVLQQQDTNGRTDGDGDDEVCGTSTWES